MDNQVIILFIILIISFAGTILIIYLYDTRDKYYITDKIINMQLGICTYEICCLKNHNYTTEVIVTKNLINFCYNIGAITKKDYIRLKGNKIEKS